MRGPCWSTTPTSTVRCIFLRTTARNILHPILRSPSSSASTPTPWATRWATSRNTGILSANTLHIREASSGTSRIRLSASPLTLSGTGQTTCSFSEATPMTMILQTAHSTATASLPPTGSSIRRHTRSDTSTGRFSLHWKFRSRRKDSGMTIPRSGSMSIMRTSS